MLLHELYPVSNSKQSSPRRVDLDIVLVHGLSGDNTTTWEAEDKTVWPRDLLPKNLGKTKIRVLSFEYSGSIRSTSSRAGINDAAQNLLQELKDKRDDLRSKYRPIVFVGHSLGGVIIKRAIRIAYNNDRFQPIKDATLGIVRKLHVLPIQSTNVKVLKMFFATPHHGNREEFLSYLSKVLQCNGPKIKTWVEINVRPTPGMLGEIMKDPGFFIYITQDFIPLYSKLSLQAFQENRITKPPGKRVVEIDQGNIGIAEEAGGMIDGDHLTLCRFGGDLAEKQRFTVISNGIKEMIDQSPRHKELMEERRRALDSLCSDSLCRSMITKEPLHGTGEWIFEREEFQDWFKETSGTPGLWISGDPGCGKSYLAKRVIDSLREQGKFVIYAFLREPDPTNIVVWNLMSDIIQQALDIEPRLRYRQSYPQENRVQSLLSGALDQVLALGPQLLRGQYPAENNMQGLLAATARQLLEMSPELIDQPPISDRKADKSPSRWAPEALKTLWWKIMTETLTRHPVVAVIDGFDKMERECQEASLEMLADFRGSQSPRNLRLLVISNEYPDLQSDLEKYQFTRYTINKSEDTGLDVEKGVGRQMKIINKIHNYSSDFREKISESVPEAASGMYLRADLMLGSLKRTFYDQENLAEMLGSSSKSTARLYDHIFGNIWSHEASRASVKDVLRWIVFQREGLTPAELSIARALTKARDNARRRKIVYDQVLEFLDENTELWVNRFCGHLVKLENGRFELIHPSLKEYLTMRPDQLRKEYGDDDDLTYHEDFYMDPSESHATLGRICVTYLSLPFFEQPLQSKHKTWFPWQEAAKERMREHKFLRYAALHWSEHLKLARDLATPGRGIREVTVDRERREKIEYVENWAKSWAEVGCYFHDWHEQDYPNLCSVDDKIIHRLTLTANEDAREEDPASKEYASVAEDDSDVEDVLTIKDTPATKEVVPSIEEGDYTTIESTSDISAIGEGISVGEGGNSTVINVTVEQRNVIVRPVFESARLPSTTAGILISDARRNHWLVRGAQKVVDKLGLEEDSKKKRKKKRR
ncbi:hypothetical protein F5Y10DRAFT_293068 [Nemania abortiva]|nr:hypothetical protein F5Y10DRAFT_293068 [Nemania abortiva]